jgi:hypothetical protein
MEKSDVTRFLPQPVSLFRAAISASLDAGGALDHLVFDKADAIRLRNIQASLAALVLPARKGARVKDRQVLVRRAASATEYGDF